MDTKYTRFLSVRNREVIMRERSLIHLGMARSLYGHYSNTDFPIKNFVMKIFSTMSILIVSLFFIAFFLRAYLIPQNLFFGPEQGRDFLIVRNIAFNHDAVLIGAKTDIEGIFHCPFYYYLATIPFLLSAGNPVFR